MRRGGRILVVLGLVLGAITAALLYFVLTSRPAPKATQTRTVKVVVAQQNIPLHAPIPPSAVTLFEWPNDIQLPKDAFIDVSQVANRLSKTPIAIGQVIVASMVFSKTQEETRKGIGSEASLIVPNGKVAVAFPINQISGVSAALKDGDTVDLLVSYDLVPAPGQVTSGVTSGVTKRQVTQIALQDVEILRVGAWNLAAGDASVSNRDAANITFLVNRQDALVLKFLRETSLEVQLALRAAGDHEKVATEPVIIEYIDTRFTFNGLLRGTGPR